MAEIVNELESSSDGARMDEFRRSTLRKMLDYPPILSELIFERLPMDLLIKLAPVVLENIEEGDGNFDDLVRPCFCRRLLQSQYKTDRILELVGKEFEAKNKRKPDRLSDILKILQKRDDLQNNPKKLTPKLTLEFTKRPGIFENCLLKSSASYVGTLLIRITITIVAFHQ